MCREVHIKSDDERQGGAKRTPHSLVSIRHPGSAMPPVAAENAQEVPRLPAEGMGTSQLNAGDKLCLLAFCAATFGL